MFKAMEPIVWFLVSILQLVVGTKLIMYPDSTTVFDYTLIVCVSVPLIIEYIVKKVRKV